MVNEILEIEALEDLTVVPNDRCMMPCAILVVTIVRFLFVRQATNRFSVKIVLENRATPVLASLAAAVLEVLIEGQSRCLKRYVLRVETGAKFLSDRQAINRYIAAIVLAKAIRARGVKTGTQISSRKS